MADELYTPLHVHGAATPAEYRAAQRRFLANRRQARPDLPTPRQPRPAAGPPPEAFVSGGKWVIRCSCGNAPSVHPDWRLALCFECGASYEGVVIPAQRRAIEQALLTRPQARQRHWTPGETADDLTAENRRNGVTPHGLD